MVSLRGRTGDAHGVVVPLCVGVPLCLVLAWNRLRAIDLRPSRHRVETPMDEDAELCIRVPLGQRVLVERLEGWFIMCGLGRRGLGYRARDGQSCRQPASRSPASFVSRSSVDLSFLISMCRAKPDAPPHVVPAEQCNDDVTKQWHRIGVRDAAAVLRDPAHHRSQRGAAHDSP